jgi:hypothetical protein
LLRNDIQEAHGKQIKPWSPKKSYILPIYAQLLVILPFYFIFYLF